VQIGRDREGSQGMVMTHVYAQTRTRSRLKSGLIVFACLAPFTFATEPLPAPDHQYILSGTISRASNGPRAFFVVSLNGKFKMIQTNPVGDLSGLYAFNADNSTPAITDSNGTFYLSDRWHRTLTH
jgi:hypothetical protein